MSTAEKAAPTPAPPEPEMEDKPELTKDEWGNGMIYVSEDDDTGAWVGIESDEMADLEDWR